MRDSKYRYFLLILAICFLIYGVTEATERPKIGLVLSGGGAMGFAHIPTLQMIDSLQIPVDYIAGTSMGGITGALYAIGYTGDEIEQIAEKVDWQGVFIDKLPRRELPYFRKQEAEKYQFELGIKDFRPIDPGGVIVGQNIMLLLSRLVFDYAHITNFDSLPTPFRCIAVDLVTGKEVVLGKGSLAKAMRSTMAVPSIFSPVEWGDSILVDGGLLNNLPVDVARDMGADIIIASAVGSGGKRQEIRTSLDVIRETFNIMRNSVLSENAEDADILIRSPLDGFNGTEFNNEKIRQIIAQGKIAAEKAKPELLKLKRTYQLRSNRYYLKHPEADSTFMISYVQISGNHVIPETAIREIVKIKAGMPFSQDAIDQCMKRLRETGDYYWVRYTTTQLEDKSLRLNIILEEKKRPIIHGVYIYGNETLPFDFIYRILGIKPGEIFRHNQVEERISYLYSLGYFERIYYDIDQAGENSVRFKLYVKENPELKIQLGLRYDDYYNLIAALNIQLVNRPIPGLRLENEIQFIGREKISSLAYYPSRTMDFPLYPFANFDYERFDLFVYDQDGNKAATYRNRFTQTGFGLGLLYKNYWNVESSWTYEWANFYPIVGLNDPVQFPRMKDEFWKLKLSTNIDRLDDAFNPREGTLVHADYEKSLQDVSNTGFIRVGLSMEYYFTFARKHTIHMQGYYSFLDADSLNNKFILLGGSQNFVGMEYNQLMATDITMGRLDYRYQIQPKLYLSLIGNVIINYENSILQPGLKPDYLIGYGVGLKYLSPLGPLELIFSRGNKSAYQPDDMRTVVYLNAGYSF